MIKDLCVLTGTANPGLAERICAQLGVPLGKVRSEVFPDGERGVTLQCEVRERDVFLIQPTQAPMGDHLIELLLLADACARAGARRVTGVMPYLGYARQDRRESAREPVGARVIADMLGSGRLDRLITVDLHSRAVEGFFRMPVEQLSAVELLASHLQQGLPEDAVVVSPDLGAVKLAERYGALLDLPVAVVHKHRLSATEVSAGEVIGQVQGRTVVLVDDMISTAGTLEAAAGAVLRAGCAPGLVVCATHALLVGPALERLARMAPRRILVSDSVPGEVGALAGVERVGLAPVLSEAIARLAGK